MGDGGWEMGYRRWEMGDWRWEMGELHRAQRVGRDGKGTLTLNAEFEVDLRSAMPI
jgi:hypothetical protein